MRRQTPSPNLRFSGAYLAVLDPDQFARLDVEHANALREAGLALRARLRAAGVNRKEICHEA